ncbi:hypothetical protein OF83DRAFT_1178251 [Amylostereum chailletii]|nr:hypothetical protein OF83DRAFT_1178251 [Amylostereum chailletii]
MALLLESGTVYCLLWLFVVGYSLDKVTTYFSNGVGLKNAGDNFVKGALIQLVGIYPTLVIVLVCLERSHCDHHFTDLPPVPIRPEINLRRVTMAASASRARESSVFVIDGGEYNSSELSGTLVDETQKASDVEMTGTV